MTSISISVAVGVATFGLGMLGLYLKRLLPARHMPTGSKEMIGAIMGLVSLLLALVLGTLVGSAWGFFASQKANIETLCARSLELDLAFRQYGLETQPLREALRASMTGVYDAIWGNAPRISSNSTLAPICRDSRNGTKRSPRSAPIRQRRPSCCRP